MNLNKIWHSYLSFIFNLSSTSSDDPGVASATTSSLVIIIIFLLLLLLFSPSSRAKTAGPIWLKFSPIVQDQKSPRGVFHFFKFPFSSWVIALFRVFYDLFCGHISSVTTEARVNLFRFSERPKTVVVHLGFKFGLSAPWKKSAWGWK